MEANTAGELFSTNIYISWITFENRSGSKWRNDHAAHSHSKRSPRTAMKKIFEGKQIKDYFQQLHFKKNIMLLFSRKGARIFAYKVSDQINAWPKRHRVIFSISRTVDRMDLKRYWRGAHVFLFETLKPRGDTSPLRDPNGSPYIPLTT